MLYRKIKTMSIILFIVCLTLFYNLNILVPKNFTTVQAENILEGKSECVIEMNSKRILYAKNSDIRLPMASTTKILTAITVLDNCNNLDYLFTIPKEADGIEGSSVYLKSGDVYSIKDLLYGLLLRSGNDCATALALYNSATIADFSSEMNNTAQKAGALESHFENPHGLPKPLHYSTAKDLCYITAYAMKNPVFSEIVSTKYYSPRNWKNKNKLLTLYKNAIGGKTGYTKEAGRCLVSVAKKNDMSLICTLLNCSTTYERTIQLFEDVFNHYNYKRIVSAGDVLSVKVGNKTIEGRLKEDFYYPLLKEEEELIEIKTFFGVDTSKSVKNKEIIGHFEIYLAKRLLFFENLYKL